jgi:SAM-dependent methyltransferase
MEWVEAFYRRQYGWIADQYLGDVDEHHRDLAATLARLAGPPPRRVLELGAGGGQNAAAAADLGFDVVAVDLLAIAAEHARRLAAQPRPGTFSVVEGDFYEVDVDGNFDVVCYWDGFGIGTDDDQRRLLRRVNTWLRPEGQALIEVYTPWYWARTAGRTVTFGEIARRYDFNAEGNRMLDRWWPADDPGSAVEQSLRCYAPADLTLLLEGTGLVLTHVEPLGTIDEASGQYVPEAPLLQAMSYIAVLVHTV